MVTDVTEVQWRKDFYEAAKAAREHNEQQMRDSVYYAQLRSLEIYGVAEVAEYFGCSRATAYNQMRSQIIPSFQVGRRWYTHGYMLEVIRRKAEDLISAHDYIKRSYPRMVYKYDAGKKW